MNAWAFPLGTVGLFCLLAAVGASEPAGGESAAVTLRQAAQARKLLVGTAVFPEGLQVQAYAAVLAREFNALTPENAMKWEPIHPNPNEWRFEPADRLVEFAASNGMKVTGHTLVWHRQLPDYVKFLLGDDLKEGAVRRDDWAVGSEAFRQRLDRPRSRPVPRVRGRPRESKGKQHNPCCPLKNHKVSPFVHGPGQVGVAREAALLVAGCVADIHADRCLAAAAELPAGQAREKGPDTFSSSVLVTAWPAAS